MAPGSEVSVTFFGQLGVGESQEVHEQMYTCPSTMVSVLGPD